MDTHQTPFAVGVRKTQSGGALIVVLIVLVLVELIGVAAAQIALMSERSARSSRDTEIAWQSAEAALADAEFYISAQPTLFDGKNAAAFVVGCGASGASKGLCANSGSTQPPWLTVDLTDEAGHSIPYGYAIGSDEETERNFAVGSAGLLPAKVPRYIIELVPDTSGTQGAGFVYRVTAIGFGPRPEVQAVLQMIYRV